jgi:hypothetical protein
MKEWRKKYPNSFPHCDSNVLHAPGSCQYCDGYSDWQQERIKNKINFTGETDPNKAPCPAMAQRPIENIEAWYGNVPQPLPFYEGDDL